MRLACQNKVLCMYVCMHRQKAVNFNSYLKTFLKRRVSFRILHSNKAHRNQNNIPTLYSLEIDSSVLVKVFKFHLYFAGLYKKLKKQLSCCHD